MNVPSNIRKTALVAAVTLAVSGITTLDNDFNLQVGFSSVISSAYAGDGSSGGGHKGAMGANKGGQGERGQGGQGHKGGKSVAEVLADDGEEEDSDRPDWAAGGDGEKPGGGNKGGNNQKGGDYGDLVVMLRDDDGNLIESPDGDYYLVQADGTVVEMDGGEVPAGAEPIPVEVGRLNVVRAPQSVMDHSLVEALSKLDTNEDGAVTVGVEVTMDASGRLITPDGLTIDSPLESLAIYQSLLTAENVDGFLVLEASSSHDGGSETYTVLVPESMQLDLAAAALAAGSDKTGDLTIDEIIFTSNTLGVADELSALVGDFTYDREDTYNKTVDVLMDLDGDGTYKIETVNLMDYVGWGDIEENSIVAPDNADGDGIDIFAQAADDSVQVLEFVHEYTP